MARRGCAGALVDGGVRDVGALGRHGFPVYARFRTPVQSIGRWRVVSYGEPVRLPGATVARVEVRPGDLVLADDDGGALVVPRARVAEVLERAEALAAQEGEVRRALEGGLSLSEALERFGAV
jgi:regulator of RNase E activity RraA